MSLTKSIRRCKRWHLDKNKAKEYLGIANKAGFVIVGSDKLSTYKQKLFLILLDNSAGKATQKIAARFEGKCPILQVDDLGFLSAISTCKVLGVKNKSLSENIIKNLTEN